MWRRASALRVPRPPHIYAAPFRRRHPCFRAVADLLPLELGEHGQLAKEHTADGGGGVDAMGERDKVDLPFPQFAEDLEQVQRGATEPVELPDHQRIAGLKMGEECIKSRPVCVGTR